MSGRRPAACVGAAASLPKSSLLANGEEDISNDDTAQRLLEIDLRRAPAEPEVFGFGEPEPRPFARRSLRARSRYTTR
jgi:hypothetical protein